MVDLEKLEDYLNWEEEQEDFDAVPDIIMVAAREYLTLMRKKNKIICTNPEESKGWMYEAFKLDIEDPNIKELLEYHSPEGL